jgi:hypothetical protein
MTLVGVLGLLLGLIGFVWMTQFKDNRRLFVWVSLVTAHVVTAVVYYYYVQSNDADTKLYYYDLYSFAALDFQPGTLAVVKATQALRAFFGGTYLDYFLLYQVLGIWGIAFIYRMLEDLSLILDQQLTPAHYALLLLPGMFFWTSAIGKDAPMFFASAMAVWSCFAIGKRWPWFALALVPMILIRPHIALVTLAALGLAVVMGRGVSLSLRALLLGAVAVSGTLLFGTVQSQLGTTESGGGSLANLVETAANAAGDNAEGSLARAALPVKLFSVLYRPFFVDANGIFGLIASLQNIAMIAITIALIRNFRLWAELFRASLLVRFVTIHASALFLLLALMYYNVGLGLRQREMATPALIVLAVAVSLVAQRRRIAGLLAPSGRGAPAIAA